MSTIRTVIKRVLPDIALDVVTSVRSYRDTHGVYPNLFRPANFNEKVIVRSLFDSQIEALLSDAHQAIQRNAKRTGGLVGADGSGKAALYTGAMSAHSPSP